MKTFIQLIGLRPDPFGTIIEDTRNFPDSKEGEKKLDEVKKAWEGRRLVCTTIRMPAPEITGI